MTAELRAPRSWSASSRALEADTQAACDAEVVIDRLDHLVLTVADIERTVAFYECALGMRREDFAEGRVALRFGDQKLNLHQVGREFDPKALRPTPGSGDLCFIAAVPLEAVEAALMRAGVAVEEGPVDRAGALGPIRSLYFRDPDGNLVEVSVYHSPHEV